ncbi:MAG: 4Fe-4S dicluster domain-containing protein [Firmicutes bacterium]|jgi:predicted aldo/keto reductase-like oxidoreductase|nr:4Fe-4S dicluster domain-containing protein [Bacillota bacterium]
MVYKNFKNLKLSALGMGCMRLPVIDNNDSNIDEQKTAEMVAYAMKNGINYYDTAWGYHNGNSEIVMGNVLSKYPRENYYLATKFPGYDISNMDKVEQIFEKQLEKCQVEYFDFYLFHNVCEMNIDAYLDEQYKIFEYLMKQKQNGRIRHLGFSAHGSYDIMRRFLEKYGESMEFCQIQLNYIDWTFQNAKSKIELLNQYHIPVWVMEPLRGGKIANLTKQDIQKLNTYRENTSAVEWAFRFLQTLPEVTMILSGMSNLEQLKQNIETFQTEKTLQKNEMDALLAIADGILNGKLPCTSCRYCTSHCPQQLDIPRLLELYNEHTFTGGGFIAPMVMATIPKEKQPSACVGCRSCEAVCPQQIKISEAMSDFASKLNG